jgi:hypothetical protein
VLQAPGSKAEARRKRREEKKRSYAKYLESPTWRKIRRAALERDGYLCRACGKKATVVHHIRYPKKLGEERMSWLYSLCRPCHDRIHEICGPGRTLRKATNLVLDGVGKVKVLPDDHRLSAHATRRRQLGSKSHEVYPRKKKNLRNIKTKQRSVPEKKQQLIDENERLHQAQARAKRRRR